MATVTTLTIRHKGDPRELDAALRASASALLSVCEQPAWLVAYAGANGLDAGALARACVLADRILRTLGRCEPDDFPLPDGLGIARATTHTNPEEG